MKLQIIETQDYILTVSDEEIKHKNIILHIPSNCILDADEFYEMNGNTTILFNDLNKREVLAKDCKKIIAYQTKNNAPELNGLPLLPEIVVEDDVEKLAKLKYPINSAKGSMEMLNRDQLNNSLKQEGFIEGYKAATKVYSEEDVIDFSIFRTTTNTKEFHNCKNVYEQFNLWKSLKQSKTPKWFVAEIDCDEVRQCMCETNDDCLKPKLKTTTINGKTYLVGTYLYE